MNGLIIFGIICGIGFAFSVVYAGAVLVYEKVIRRSRKSIKEIWEEY